jgi:hypothetical protein
MTDLDPQLHESLQRLVRRGDDAPLDWNDVVRRARAARRRAAILVGAMLAVLVVGVASGFGFGPGLWRLVAGTPVSTKRLPAEERRLLASMSSGKAVLRTEPDAPELRQLPRKVSIRLLANRAGYTFYVIDVRGRSQQRCLAIGHVGRPRLVGGLDCSPRPFPSPQRPVADFSMFNVNFKHYTGTRVARLVGIAADGVAKVGLLDSHWKLIAPVPVVNNTYLHTTGLPTVTVTAVVGYTAGGKRVYCQDVVPNPILKRADRSDPCGELSSAVVPGPTKTIRHSPPPFRRAKLGKHLQHGSARGVAVNVYAPGSAIFNLSHIDPAALRLISGPAGPNFGCLRVRFFHGRWLADEHETSGTLAGRFRWDFVGGLDNPAFFRLPAPYDGCEIGGLYGHRWNDAYGTRTAVEIPLTPAGRKFFNDRAAARDLAYFVRSGPVQRIRLSSSAQAELSAFTRRYPGRVVQLSTASQRAAEHTIGFWISPQTIVFSTTSSTGRSFFVIAKRATLRLRTNNLGDLALVF